MERIFRSNAVATSSQGRTLHMKIYDFYFYYYLVPLLLAKLKQLRQTQRTAKLSVCTW